MTGEKTERLFCGRKKARGRLVPLRGLGSAALSLASLSLVIFFAAFLSGEASEFALSGMRLAVLTVLPSAFPSMLVCDLYRRVGYPEKIPLLGRAFSLLFGISQAGLRAFILGNLCGFPMGAREVGAAYSEGALSREEAERLLPLSTNPSPAFVVGAVGGAMLGDFRAGAILLCCVLLSSALCGVVYRKKRVKSEVSHIVLRQSYSFIESVRSAGGACIAIISFISAFSVMLGFCKKYLIFLPLRSAAFALLEVTGGVDFFIRGGDFSPVISGVMTAFTLGFGGLSVMLQSAALASDFGLKLRGYLRVKLTQGAVCALLYFGVISLGGYR